MDWTVDDIPDQSARIALVTGANSGLGFETSKVLLDKGAKVIMACRSKDNAEAAKKKLLSQNSQRQIDTLAIDLADLSSINNISRYINQKYKGVNSKKTILTRSFLISSMNDSGSLEGRKSPRILLPSFRA